MRWDVSPVRSISSCLSESEKTKPMATKWEDVEITQLEDARRFFQEMGCSHFHMSREYPEKYEQYRTFLIPEQIESKWRQESIYQTKDKLLDSATPKGDLWFMHSQVAELAEVQKSTETLIAIWEATKSIFHRLSPKDGLLVAETINGRKEIRYQDGLIFLAAKLNRPDIAAELVAISLSLSQEAKKQRVDIPRCDKAITKCQIIQKKLNL